MAKKSTGGKLENNTSGKKAEEHLKAEDQAVKRHAAHPGNRRGTGVHWKVDSRRSNVRYGAGVASPEKRRANAAARNTTGTSTFDKIAVGGPAVYTPRPEDLPEFRAAQVAIIRETQIFAGQSTGRQDTLNQLLDAFVNGASHSDTLDVARLTGGHGLYSLVRQLLDYSRNQVARLVKQPA